MTGPKDTDNIFILHCLKGNNVNEFLSAISKKKECDVELLIKKSLAKVQ